MNNIYIVTDSTADIPSKFAKEHNVSILPLTITHKGKTYEDGINISTEDLLKMLQDEEIPKTSQVNPKLFMDLYSNIIKKGGEIISIHISSGLSGVYQSACIARNLIGSDKIHIFDSKNVSFGTGILVYEAVRMVESGYAINDIVENLNSLIPRVRMEFVVDTLEYLAKGGRISNVAATVGNLLNIKPIVYTRDGKLEVLDKPRGVKRAYNRMIQYLEEETFDKNLCFCVGNVICTDEANEVIKMIKDTFNINDIYTINAGPSIATYCGPGTIGIYFFTKDEK